MRIGAVFPQTEIGDDPGGVRGWAQGAEDLGCRHVLAYDHVLGAATDTRPSWTGPYDSADAFHEVFVLFGFLAAVTTTLELVTGVLVLPQRQTALVAKQAAALDVLSGGRLRLGVGIGWNRVEYQALGEDFGNRGARSAEQVRLLRELWANPAVTFRGRWHEIDNAGLRPRPVRGTIPVWFGGSTEPVLRRIGQLGDGWLPQRGPDAVAAGMIDRIRDYAGEAGRKPADIGIESRLTLANMPETDWPEFVAGWRDLGATHLSVNTMGLGLTSPDGHIAALRHALAVIG